jgi:hypothetical protein
MAEPVYGALENLIPEEENSSPTFDVYQQRTQTYDQPQYMQYTYGTGQNPVFQWVETIKTGERTYDPNSQFDQDMLDEYNKMWSTGLAPPNALSPEEITKQIIGDVVSGVGVQAGRKIGQALVDPYLADESLGTKIFEGAKSTVSGDLPYNVISETADLSKKQLALLDKNKLTFDPELATKDSAIASGRVDEFIARQNKATDLNASVKGADPKYAYPQDQSMPQTLEGVDGQATTEVKSSKGGFTTTAGGTATPTPNYWDKVGSRLYGTEAAKSNWAGAAGAGTASFFIQLASGRDPEDAAKSAVGTALGTAIGNALLPGFGGFIGGTLGATLGGRVICNELMRQKIMTREQVILDYKFTRDYLTPTHVNGYHVWAVWMVKQMRKGKFVKFWTHVAGHRANEIAYIYKKRNKPDYLGKIYRKILEPICWLVGLSCKKTDWSILYKQKEI